MCYYLSVQYISNHILKFPDHDLMNIFLWHATQSNQSSTCVPKNNKWDLFVQHHINADSYNKTSFPFLLFGKPDDLEKKGDTCSTWKSSSRKIKFTYGRRVDEHTFIIHSERKISTHMLFLDLFVWHICISHVVLHDGERKFISNLSLGFYTV